MGHSSAGGRFGEFDSPARFVAERNVRRYLYGSDPSAPNPLQDSVAVWVPETAEVGTTIQINLIIPLPAAPLPPS